MGHSLSAVDVTVTFDGLTALSKVTLDVPRESVTGLIGPNGAGKTTLVNVLTGFQKSTSGSVTMDGENIDGVAAAPHPAEGHRPHLSVRATVFGSQRARQSRGHGRGPRALAKAGGRKGRCHARVDRHHGSRRAHGGRASVYGRAACRHRPGADDGNPRYLLLDEPAAGMSSTRSRRSDSLIHRIVCRARSAACC